MNDLFKSKRVWVALATIAFVFFKETMKLPVTEEQVQAVFAMAASWIVGDSLRATTPKHDVIDEGTLDIVAEAVAKRIAAKVPS